MFYILPVYKTATFKIYIYIRKQFFQKNLVSKNIDILKSLEEKIIILWERDEEDLGFSGSSVVKDLPANAQV